MSMRILVATDGTSAAVGALRMAQAVAQRHDAAVDVITVLEPFPMYGTISAEAMTFHVAELEAAGREALRAKVAAQLTDAGPEIAAWPLTVAVGAPAPTIARTARETGATMIILGLGRHAVADRLFGTETALRVIRLSHIPVLAVPTEAASLPTTAVAAIDFTDFSILAAERAVELLGPSGVLHLVHVFWRPSEEVPWVGGRDWVVEQRERMQEQLHLLARRLGKKGAARVEVHFMEGEAARETLRLAESLGATLVSAGSHGSGFFSRLLMGSVSTRLMRGCTSAVLIVPPVTVPAELQPGATPAGKVAARGTFSTASRG